MSDRSSIRLGAIVLLVVGTLTVALAAVGPGSAAADESAAVRCQRAQGERQTVLLIHGTGGTPDEVWGSTYEQALPRLGYGVCTVQLPDRALGSFADSVPYAVRAARIAYQKSGRKIAMVGHSQGGLMVAWLIKFFPDIAAITDDAISLAGPMRGTELANTLCVARQCTPLAWQLRVGSQLIDAFVRAPLPAGPPVTSVGTRFDTVVYPQPATNRLTGASSLLVQDICPGHPVEHVSMVTDGAVFRIVVDALAHPGPARRSRISPRVCADLMVPGLDGAAVLSGGVETMTSSVTGLLDPARFVDREPAVPAYARS